MKAVVTSVFFIFYLTCNAQQKEAAAGTETIHARELKNCMRKAEGHLSRAGEMTSPKAADSALFHIKKAEKLSSSQRAHAQIGVLRSKAFRAKGNMTDAFAVAQKSKAIFSKIGDNEGIGDAWMAMAQAKETHPQEYISFYDSAREAYRKSKSIKKEALALRECAFWTMSADKMSEGKKLLEETLPLYKKAGDPHVQKVYSLLAIIELENGNLDKAMENSLKAAKLIDASGQKVKDDGEAYNYIGIAYTQTDDYETAGRYFKSGYEIAKRYDDQQLQVMLLTNLIANTMSRKKYDEALTYLKPLEKDFASMPPPVQTLVISRSLLAYSFIKDYKSGRKYAAMAENRLAALPKGDPNWRMFLPGLVTYHFGAGNYDKAKRFALRYRDLSLKNNDKEALKDIYKRLSQIDSAEGSYKTAWENYRLYSSYRDSLSNEEVGKRIAELQVQYESEKKDNAIKLKDKTNSLLKKESELQKSKLSEATLVRNLSFAALALLGIAIALLIIRYNSKQKTNRILESQKNEINLKNASLEKLLDEKEWLVKEIHHRVKNNLQMVMSLLNAQTHYLENAEAATAIRDSQHRIHSMSLIHRKLYQSENVTTINMSVYICELVEYFTQIFNTGQRITFATEVEPIDLDTAQAVPIGLIVNECITNSIKYAFPDDAEGKISIFLMLLKDDVLKLQISDDGIGMDPARTNTKISLGLQLIRGLAEDLEAKLEMATTNGVLISLEFKYEPGIKTPTPIHIEP